MSFYDRGIKRYIKITAEASSAMKFSKPIYDTNQQVYRVEIQDGIRFQQVRESGEWKDSLDKDFYGHVGIFSDEIIRQTQGWFSKSLTPEYLKPRLQYQCPTENWVDFEGTVEWETKTLLISKQAFLFLFAVASKTPVEKHIIDLADEEEDTKSVSPPLDEDAEPLTVGPTRRRLYKDYVMQARAKAARALYKAEQLTQAYCDEFGEDTDWEDESSEEEEEEEED